MIKHYCDICGKQLDGAVSYRLTYQYVQHTDSIQEYHSGKKDMDLCDKCFDIFEQTWTSEKEVMKNDTEGNT